MSQLNMQTTPKFESDLAKLMKARGIKTKSEAIRIAVEEALVASRRERTAADFSAWRALGRAAPDNPQARFRSDDDLWDEGAARPEARGPRGR